MITILVFKLEMSGKQELNYVTTLEMFSKTSHRINVMNWPHGTVRGKPSRDKDKKKVGKQEKVQNGLRRIGKRYPFLSPRFKNFRPPFQL